MEPLFLDLKEGIITLDELKARESANRVIAEGIDLLQALDSCTEGLAEIGTKFQAKF